MTSCTRRRFLEQATTAGAACSTNLMFGGFPWAQTSASGANAATRVYLECELSGMDHLPYVDVSATYHAESKEVSVLVLNRDLSKAREVELRWEDHAPSRVADSQILTGDDLKAFNTFEAPERVKPRPFEKPSTSNMLTRFAVPPRSYSVVQWSY